jgi:hypothetical protein
MKVFRNKITGRLGETQYGDNEAILITNAKAAGFKNNEIEIIDMIAVDYNEAIRLQNIADSESSPSGIKKKEVRDKLKSKLNLTEDEARIIL